MPAKIKFIVLLLVALCLFAATFVFVLQIKGRELPTADTAFPWKHVDLMPVWLGSRLLLNKKNPYDDAATRAIQTAYYGRPLRPSEQGINIMGFAYPATTAIFFAPLAVLPWNIVSALSFFTMAAATVISVLAWISVLGIDATRRKQYLYCVFAFASWPAVWGLRLENLTLLVLPIIAAGCWCLHRKRYVLAGILLAAATVKPQLILLLLPWLILRAIIKRNWRFVLSFSMAMAVALAATFYFFPAWIPAWHGAVNYYISYTRVSVMFPHPAVAAIALTSIYVLWKLRHSDFGLGIGFSLAAAYIIQPVNGPTTYNFLCLLPGCIYLIEKPLGGTAELFRRIAIGTVILEFALVLIGVAVYALHGIFFAGALLNFFLPIAVFVALFAAAWKLVNGAELPILIEANTTRGSLPQSRIN